jgi:hypothetical protein
MRMDFFGWSRYLRTLRGQRRKTPRAPYRRRVTPRVEPLEDRIVLTQVQVQFALTSYSVMENAGHIDVRLVLNTPAPTAMSVHLATIDGSAHAPGDFTAFDDDVTFDAGTVSLTVPITIVNDSTVEPNEVFHLQLSDPKDDLLIGAANAADVTIQDDDTSGPNPSPLVSISDESVTEGNSGTVNATFIVSLSFPSMQAVTVHYATANGSATAPADYTVAAGTLTIPANTSSVTFTVSVVGDTLDEGNEAFLVNLSNPAGADLSDSQGVCTIRDDDLPALSISDSLVTEGNTGSVSAPFTVTLSAPSPHAVTVRYATIDGTATANNDYTPVNPTLISFDPYETSKTVSISVLGDTLSEAQEYFTVRLSGPGSATIADGWGQGTIVDNDPVPTVQLDANSFSASEGGLFLVTAHLSMPSGQTVTVHYATSDGTATAPADYTDTHGTLTFSPGQTSQTLSVPIVDDTSVEPEENLSLTLSSPFHADLAEPTAGTLTLHDNDPSSTSAPRGTSSAKGPAVQPSSCSSTPAPRRRSRSTIRRLPGAAPRPPARTTRP